MKSLIPVWLVLAAVALPTVGLGVTADSNISEVTVYLDRAVVTRQAQVELPVGQSEVVFERLPRSLMSNSLQVGGSAAAPVTILDVSSHQNFVSFEPDPRIEKIRQQLDDLDRQRRIVADRTNQIKSQRQALDRYQQAVLSDHRPTPPSADEVTKLMDFQTQTEAKLADEQRKMDAEDAALERQQQALESQRHSLNQLTSAKSFTAVTVRLTVPSATTVRLTVTYAVPNARWSPTYEARTAGEDGRVALGYFGTVQQQTGEDWTGVKLSLSTAQPSLGGSPGKLTPWAVGIPAPALPSPVEPVFSPQFSFNTGSLKLAAVAGAGKSPETVQMDAFAVTGAQVAVMQAATSTSFVVDQPVTIPSDNRPEKEPIATLQLASQTDYLAIPKNRLAVFLTSHVVNNSDLVLLPGPMAVFLDGNFVATDRLETVLPTEKFDLALGVDERVTIKRKLQRQVDDEPGFINRRKRTTYEFLITVENHEQTAVTVLVKDQVPVSRSDKVVVKVLEPDSNELKSDDDGIVQWTVNLKPGEKREIPLKFTVNAPVGTSVYGL